jgi:ribosomal protein S12 methylthiotransferase accessory factor
MHYDPSTLFDKEGYISLKEYVKDIEEMKKNGPWKLPLNGGDRFQFKLLSFFSQFSWFSDRLFIKHQGPFSPAYSMLLGYLKKNGIYDSIFDKSGSRHGYFSFLLEKKTIRGGEPLPLYGQGVSRNKAIALSIAMGEMIERTITGLYDENRSTIYASARSLLEGGKRIIYPPLFHRFLDVQKEKFPSIRSVHVDTPLSWVKGRNIRTGETTYIPKKLTSWLKENQDNKEVIIHATTNGSAGYFSKQEAVLRGILEIVERDGFLVHWLTKIVPEIIDKETLPETLRSSIKIFENDGVTLHVLNVTSLGIPSVVIAGIGPSATGEPQVIVSGGSAITFTEAISSAIKEFPVALEMLKSPRELENTNIEPFVGGLDKIERQLYWRGEKKVEKFTWFLSGVGVGYEDLMKRDLMLGEGSSSRLETCLLALAKGGPEYDPVVYFPSNKIQRKVGFYIAQIFIPKAFPLYLFEGYGTFDSDRLKEFAFSKGVREFSVNEDPHMFS